MNIKELEQRYQWLVVYDEISGTYKRLLSSQVDTVVVKQDKQGRIVAVKGEDGKWHEAMVLYRDGAPLGNQSIEWSYSSNKMGVDVGFTAFNGGEVRIFPEYTYTITYKGENGQPVSETFSVKAVKLLVPAGHEVVGKDPKTGREKREVLEFIPMWFFVDAVNDKGEVISGEMGRNWKGSALWEAVPIREVENYMIQHPGVEVIADQVGILIQPENLKRYLEHRRADVRRRAAFFIAYGTDPRIRNEEEKFFACAKKVVEIRKTTLGRGDLYGLENTYRCDMPAPNSLWGSLDVVILPPIEKQ